MRTPHGEFDGYHTSADALDRISAAVARGVRPDAASRVIDVLETNRTLVNLSPYGEPQLGRRGLYRSAGGAVATPDDERALLWVLNQSDGDASLLDIADRSGHRLPGHPARGRAARAGASCWRRRSVVRPRPVSLGDEPLRGRRPLDAEGRVVPAHAARGLGHVLVGHLVDDLAVVDQRLVALREALGDEQQPPVLGGQLDAEPVEVASASPGAGRPSRPRPRRACSARACSRRAGPPGSGGPGACRAAGCGSCCPARTAIGEPVLRELVARRTRAPGSRARRRGGSTSMIAASCSFVRVKIIGVSRRRPASSAARRRAGRRPAARARA